MMDSEIVRAKRFELVDDTGKVRAVLGLLESWDPNLCLFDKDGNTRLQLGISGDGLSGLALFDAAGKLCVSLDSYPDGASMLQFSDSSGEVRATLTMTSAGDSILAFLSGKGRERQAPVRLILWANGKHQALFEDSGSEASKKSIPHLRLVKSTKKSSVNKDDGQDEES